jgi:hypothetical protein
VFEVLDDAESWPQWATAITKVTWTSPLLLRVVVNDPATRFARSAPSAAGCDIR